MVVVDVTPKTDENKQRLFPNDEPHLTQNLPHHPLLLRLLILHYHTFIKHEVPVFDEYFCSSSSGNLEEKTR